MIMIEMVIWCMIMTIKVPDGDDDDDDHDGANDHDDGYYHDLLLL